MVISRTCGKSGSDANEAKEETMVDRGSIFIDAFVFVFKDIHIDRWDWWMGAAWNGGIVFCSGNPFACCPRQKIGNVQRFAVCGKDQNALNCYHNPGGDTDGFD